MPNFQNKSLFRLVYTGFQIIVLELNMHESEEAPADYDDLGDLLGEQDCLVVHLKYRTANNGLAHKSLCHSTFRYMEY